MADWHKGQVLMDVDEGEYVVFMNYVREGGYKLAKIAIPRCGEVETVDPQQLRPLTKRERGEV